MKQLARRIILSVAFATLFSTLFAGLAQAATAPSPAVVKGTAWLQAQVQPTGALTNEPLSIATPLQNRAESLQTFKLLATVPTTLADLLATDTQDNTEYLARRAATLSLAGRDATAITTQLLARQNPDGGFGGATGYGSNALDTAWVLIALKASGSTNGKAISGAIAYLTAAQAASGAYTVGAQESLYTSSIALLALSGRYYVQYFNYSYQRTGTLWEGRYKATLIDSETYLLTCMRYIELNPVRAGMVSHPSEYPWSSYRYNALGKADALVTLHLQYRRLGKTDEERQAAYRQLFRHHIPEASLAEIREATNKAWVLGNDRFKERIQKQLERRVEPAARGGDRKSEDFRINRV